MTRAAKPGGPGRADRIPSEAGGLAPQPPFFYLLQTDESLLRDRQRQLDLAAGLMAWHLELGHSPEALIATLARAVLREGAGLYAYQMLAAGVRQFTAWSDTDEGRHILIMVALAAHSPTERAALRRLISHDG